MYLLTGKKILYRWPFVPAVELFTEADKKLPEIIDFHLVYRDAFLYSIFYWVVIIKAIFGCIVLFFLVFYPFHNFVVVIMNDHKKKERKKELGKKISIE